MGCLFPRKHILRKHILREPMLETAAQGPTMQTRKP